MSLQLPLGIQLRPDATYESFIAGPNGEAVDYLRNRFEPGQSVYLWGSAGTGKTHLLHAACRSIDETGGSAIYLPFELMDEWTPDILDGTESLALICLDDVQRFAGHEEWERRVFRLFNSARERASRILLAGSTSPRALGMGLLDLSTRFAWGPVFQLQPLGDADLPVALAARARALGMEMPDEVARYLLQHFVRDTAALFCLLDRLDHESLSAQRRLTVPFVRGVIEQRAV